MNQGSYGVTPHEVTAAAARHRARAERRPDAWFRTELFEALDGARARVAEYVNAPAEDIVFCDNGTHVRSAPPRAPNRPSADRRAANTPSPASAAVNAVLRSLRFEDDAAACLLMNISYPMTKHAARYAQEVDGRYAVQYVDVPLPSTDAEIVELVATHLDAHPEVKVVEVSHITSIPALILPVKAIARECRRRGVLTLVDGTTRARRSTT